MVLFHIFFLCARPFDQKLLPWLILLFVYGHETKIRVHSYSLIYYFLDYVNITYNISWQYRPCISCIHYIHVSTSAYISYAIFMAIWSLPPDTCQRVRLYYCQPCDHWPGNLRSGLVIYLRPGNNATLRIDFTDLRRWNFVRSLFERVFQKWYTCYE